MNYEGFIIYCFHIETCHVYDITTNESLIEYKASVMNSTSGVVITTSASCREVKRKKGSKMNEKKYPEFGSLFSNVIFYRYILVFFSFTQKKK
jgi:hypothetical protein